MSCLKDENQFKLDVTFFLFSKPMLLCLFLFVPALAYPDAAEPASGTLKQGRENFIKAEASLKSGQLETFYQLLGKLVDYPLYPYLQYAALKSNPADEEGILTFIKDSPPTGYKDILRKNYLKRLSKKGRWADFLEYYRADSEIELRCSYYRALYLTGRIKDALKGARILWLSGKSRPSECDELFLELRKSEYFSRDLAWDRFVLAIESYQVGLAHYLLGFLSPKDEMAGHTALKVHQKPSWIDGRSGISPDIERAGWIFTHGVQRLASKDLANGVEAWDRLNERYDITRRARHGTEQRLAILSAMRRVPDAYSRFSVLDPSLSSQDARFWKIRVALMNENWSQAEEAIKQLREDEKEMLKWQYWRARVIEAQHGLKAAFGQYRQIARERDYYGFLAADRIGIDYRLNDVPLTISSSQLNNLEQKKSFAVVREWLALGRITEVRSSWWQMVATMNPLQKSVAAKMAQKLGLHELAIFTIARIGNWDDLKLRFPILFRRIIDKSARENMVPLAIIYGIVRQESVFNEAAISPVGAIGLMQIMPRTGEELARQVGDQWRSTKILFDSEKNIRYGSKYLKNILERFDGNMAVAIAGYNAGPKQVSRWLPDHKKISGDLWVDSLPFRETRRYIRRVLEYSIIYQERLNVPANKISEYIPVVSPVNPSLPL